MAKSHHRLAGLARCVLATLVLATVGATPARATNTVPMGGSAGEGSIGLRLVDAPVSAGNDPRAKLYIVDHLAPGTVIQRG